jgi:hypothetical protein
MQHAHVASCRVGAAPYLGGTGRVVACGCVGWFGRQGRAQRVQRAAVGRLCRGWCWERVHPGYRNPDPALAPHGRACQQSACLRSPVVTPPCTFCSGTRHHRHVRVLLLPVCEAQVSDKHRPVLPAARCLPLPSAAGLLSCCIGSGTGKDDTHSCQQAHILSLYYRDHAHFKICVPEVGC